MTPSGRTNASRLVRRGSDWSRAAIEVRSIEVFISVAPLACVAFRGAGPSPLWLAPTCRRLGARAWLARNAQISCNVARGTRSPGWHWVTRPNGGYNKGHRRTCRDHKAAARRLLTAGWQRSAGSRYRPRWLRGTRPPSQGSLQPVAWVARWLHALPSPLAPIRSAQVPRPTCWLKRPGLAEKLSVDEHADFCCLSARGPCSRRYPPRTARCG